MIARHGFAGITAEEVATEARLPLSVFHEQFASPQDCFVALYEDAVDRLSQRVLGAAGSCEDQREPDARQSSLDAGIRAVLEFLAADPELARACLVEAPAMGPDWLERREGAIERLIGYLEMMRRAHGDAGSALASELMVRGAYEVIHARVARGEAEHLPELLGDLRHVWLAAFRDSSTE